MSELPPHASTHFKSVTTHNVVNLYPDGETPLLVNLDKVLWIGGVANKPDETLIMFEGERELIIKGKIEDVAKACRQVWIAEDV